MHLSDHKTCNQFLLFQIKILLNFQDELFVFCHDLTDRIFILTTWKFRMHLIFLKEATDSCLKMNPHLSVCGHPGLHFPFLVANFFSFSCRQQSWTITLVLVQSSNLIESHGPDLYRYFERTASRWDELVEHQILPPTYHLFACTSSQPLWEWLECAIIVVLLRCTFVLHTDASIDFNVTSHFGRPCCMSITLIWITAL